ncbi:T9SS type A sorting domain-containing protein [Neolewinella litorea]|nr:T9SS type A sorting domain-containing protein [Neolewinella litorea]
MDPADPILYQGTPLATNHAYTFLATDFGTENIVAQSPAADFRTLNAGEYQVYGVDYNTTTVTPSTFVGNTLTGIKTSGGSPTCLRVSENNQFFVVSDAPAPVDWLDFRAVTKATGVELHWEVASETENDYFRVERSIDGTNWEALDEVAGNGTRNLYAAFSSLDRTPVPGSNFYRVAQVDFDGTVNYSAVVTATWEAPATGLSTFPNPFTNRLTVRSNAELPGQPRIFDLQGRDVSQQLNITVQGQQAILEVESLPVGVYVVHWGDEQLRVVKN